MNQVLENVTKIVSPIKIAKDELFNNLKNLYSLTELDRQKDDVLDTVIFALWGVMANRGDLGLTGLKIQSKSPYILIDWRFDELPPTYAQYFDSLQRYIKVCLEDFRGLRERIEEFEKLKTLYSKMTDNVKEKVKDSRIGVFDRLSDFLLFKIFLKRMGIATKALSNVSKLKINSEALKQIELKVIREIYIAKTIIANFGYLAGTCGEIGNRMKIENQGKKVHPNEGKKYYPVALQVVKNSLNQTAMFVELPFK